jgi:hypothetical protein
LLKGRGIVLTSQYDNNLQRHNNGDAVENSEELLVTEISQIATTGKHQRPWSKIGRR